MAPAKNTAASTPETTMNFWVDQFEARLREADAERDPLFLLAARLEILQRSLDLLAARTLVLVGVAGGNRFGFCDRGTAIFGLLLSRQQRIEEDPGDAADPGGGEEGQCERLQFHGAPLYFWSAISAASRAAARRFSSL